jgi:hypothetical protein
VLEQRTSLTGGSWTIGDQRCRPPSLSQSIEVTVPRAGGSGFFRLRTP